MEENKINIKINFYDELIEHTINSNYTYFLKYYFSFFAHFSFPFSIINLSKKYEYF